MQSRILQNIQVIMIGKSPSRIVPELFRPQLSSFIDMNHELVLLSKNKIFAAFLHFAAEKCFFFRCLMEHQAFIQIYRFTLNLCGAKAKKTQKNEFFVAFLHFAAEKFGHVKKKQYLCSPE